MSTECPNCHAGMLEQTHNTQDYHCAECDRLFRAVVVNDIDAWKRVAARNGPLAPVAKAGLEGIKRDRAS